MRRFRNLERVLTAAQKWDRIRIQMWYKCCKKEKRKPETNVKRKKKKKETSSNNDIICNMEKIKAPEWADFDDYPAAKTDI